MQAGRSCLLLVAVTLTALFPSSATGSLASGEGFPIVESMALDHSLGKVDHLLPTATGVPS